VTSPVQLLAAYAAGDLSADERGRVEAYLADDADARAELAALRALIAATREARPMPTREPAWDDLARSIRLAVDEVKPRGWARGWLRPVALSGAAVAVAALVYFSAFRGSSPSDDPPERVAAPEQDPGSDLDLELPDLPDLDDAWNADSFVYELDPEEGFEDMFATVQAADEADPSIDFGVAPEFDTFIDTLTEEQIEAVDAHLEGKPS